MLEMSIVLSSGTILQEQHTFINARACQINSQNQKIISNGLVRCDTREEDMLPPQS